MSNGFYLITGTSRGIGEALALELLKQRNTVLGVSRTQSAALKAGHYHHLAHDLADASGIETILEKAAAIVDAGDFDFLCLVNSAAMAEPLKSIQRADAAEIEAHLKVGLLTPVILTSAFMRKFSVYKIRKKIAFMSSGAAVRPMPDMSMYCSSKAALKMFAECAGLEQQDVEHGFEIISVSPGMVETSMQQAVRTEQYAMTGYFSQAYADGRVQDRNEVAGKIAVILENKYQNGEFVNVRDV